jgi:pseudouridine-5'-phosphate glycosidase
MVEPLKVSEDVKQALTRGCPVVAVESVVIAHGLPGGKGSEAAQKVCGVVRERGVVPAVIGVVEGRVTVGLSDEEISVFARGEGVLKASTRELAGAVAKRLSAATTVSATVHIAMAAGIIVTVTGGMGGVHRDASSTFDISSDLWQLANTPAVVVCAGVKTVLDVQATLEWLETHQVGVYALGSDEFPAFYSAGSGCRVEKVDTIEEAAEIYKSRIGLGLRGAMVLAVPVPKEHSLELEEPISQAIEEAREQGIDGSALTPWLLKRVQEMVGKKAVETNIALLENNASAAAEMAAMLASDGESRKIGFH